MDDTLYYLCYTHIDCELELISSHATHEEAWKELYAQMSTTTRPGFLEVMCIAELERQVRYSTNEQYGIRNRISRKRKQRKECQRERALLRRLLGELPDEAYLPLTAKFIELTDFIEKSEQYIKNGYRRIKRCSCAIEKYRQDIALLRAAICAATAANTEAIE